MYRNYLRTALRNLKKHFGYTAINLAGLALGLTVTLQIFLFVQSELSYDSFHENASDIYRVTLDGSFSGTELNAPVTPAPMSAALVSDFPEVLVATRIFPFAKERMIRRGDFSYLDDGILMVDSTFFDVLTFPLVQGDAVRALARPNTVVLTESTAGKIFGDTDPVGETIIMGDTTRYEITGLVADPPRNSHIQFSVLQSMTGFQQAASDFWISNNFFTYLRLTHNASPDALEDKLPEFFKEYAGPQIAQAFGKSYDEVMTGDNRLTYHLQPIGDVHLRSNFEIDLQPSGDINSVYLFIAVAVFILLLACINFMNLATARASGRAMEVGIRKVVGSSRRQLMIQFLSESTLLSLFAMILAVGLVFASTPLFNSIADQTLHANVLLRPTVLLVLAAGAILVGVLAGSYPAIFLSSFSPAAVIKGQSSTGRRKSLLRNGLVVFQFGISFALLIGTLIVGDQMDYIRNRNLGFDKEHVLVVERAGQLRDQADAFEDKLRNYSGIESVGGTTAIPGGIHGSTAFQPEGWSIENVMLMSPVFVDQDFVEAMGIEMVEGRDFSRDFPADTASIVINQAALKEIGWDSATGKQLGMFGQGSTINQRTIIGVIRDYNYASLRRKIGAMALVLGNFPMPYLVVRVQGNHLQDTMEYIRNQWAEFVPEQPIQYSFLDENFDKLFAADRRLGRLFSSFSIFAIFIACLGLFGLSLFVTEQRTKEIGVRKSLGASVGQIVVLLSREFTVLVVVSMTLSGPIAWYFMRDWLNGFVYRTDIHITSFLLAGALALVIAWLTVSYQSIRAAVADPVDSLRYE